MRKGILIFFLCALSLSAKTIVFFPAFGNGLNAEERYLLTAYNDIAQKHAKLFADLNENETHETGLTFLRVKQNARALAEKYNADILVAATITAYNKNVTLAYFIYDASMPYQWKEKNISDSEPRFFNIMRNFFYDLYEYAGIDVKRETITKYLTESTYTPLMGYYADLAAMKNDSERVRAAKRKEALEKFYLFFPDNLFVNLDYYDYLLDARDETAFAEVTKDLQSKIGEQHHYMHYLRARAQYNEFRRKVNRENLQESMDSIGKAIRLENNYYLYHYMQARLFYVQEEYDNAEFGFEKVVAINPYHVQSYKGLLAILKRSALRENNARGIEYAKRILEVEPYDRLALDEITALYDAEGDVQNALFYYEYYNDGLKKDIAALKNNPRADQRYLYSLMNKSRALEKRIQTLRAALRAEERKAQSNIDPQ